MTCTFIWICIPPGCTWSFASLVMEQDFNPWCPVVPLWRSMRLMRHKSQWQLHGVFGFQLTNLWIQGMDGGNSISPVTLQETTSSNLALPIRFSWSLKMGSHIGDQTHGLVDKMEHHLETLWHILMISSSGQMLDGQCPSGTNLSFMNSMWVPFVYIQVGLAVPLWICVFKSWTIL